MCLYVCVFVCLCVCVCAYVCLRVCGRGGGVFKKFTLFFGRVSLPTHYLPSLTFAMKIKEPPEMYQDVN